MRGCAAAVGLVAALVSAASCSSGPKKNTVHEFQSVIAEPMRIRRPKGPGADPKVGPGGPDYLGHPLPDERYDCRPPATLFDAAEVSAIRTCVESVQSPLTFTYRLVRNPAPELVIAEPTPGSEPFEALPECVRTKLLKIPVPREVFFFAEKDDREGYQCYSARTDVNADTPFGVRLPIEKWTMDVTLPLENPVTDDAMMLRVLIGWALTPVMRPETSDGRIQGRAVPEVICGRCFEGVMIPERKFPYPPTWP